MLMARYANHKRMIFQHRIHRSDHVGVAVMRHVLLADGHRPDDWVYGADAWQWYIGIAQSAYVREGEDVLPRAKISAMNARAVKGVVCGKDDQLAAVVRED